MTRIAIVNGRIATGDGILDGATITVADGRIAAIDADGAADTVVNLAGGWLMPGFVDTQVNGGGGVLLNDDPTVAGIAAIAAAHRPYGTTAMMPTLISDDLPMIAAALDAGEAAMAAGVPGIVGVHIEGPVLNVARKGIHDPARFRALDDEMITLLTRPRGDLRVMVTLAPEMVDPASIRRLAAAGVIVSVGHTDADHDTAVAAFAAGVTGVTHLFNAMSALHHREPGMVGAALDDQQVWCGLIADDLHVHATALRIALRARPIDRFMLVTDAMPCVGAVNKDFVLQGRAIRVVDGRCVDAGGTLAGSDLDMAGAVRRIVALAGVSPADAAIMAATAPAAFLRLSGDRGRIAPGLRADWVRLTADLQPAGTWIGGEQVADGA